MGGSSYYKTFNIKMATVLPADERVEVLLPSGKLGISFMGEEYGGSPPWISKIDTNSPIKDKVVEGMTVDSLILVDDDENYSNLDLPRLIDLVVATYNNENRIMVLRKPPQQQQEQQQQEHMEDEPPAAEIFEEEADEDLMMRNNVVLLPDKKEIILPSGKIGVTFHKSDPPTIKSIADDSPLKGIVDVGMVVDMLLLNDGMTFTGLSTKELLVEIKNSSEEEGRIVLLKNPTTQDLSCKEIILPAEKEVILPTSRIGVNFKGSNQAKIMSINDDSPMKNIFRVGMIVSSVYIPGEDQRQPIIMKRPTAKELVGILSNSKGISGRKVVLKDPSQMIISNEISNDPLWNIAAGGDGSSTSGSFDNFE